MRLDDIMIRNILHIEKYDYNNRCLDIIYKYYNFPFFYQNNTQIIVGFYINTIDGFHWIPVISMKDIRRKISVKNELKYNIQNIKEKGKEKIKNLLLDYTCLPIELISIICSFY